MARYDGLQIDAAGDEKPFGFSIQKLYIGKKSVFEAPAGTMVEIELPKGYPHLNKGDKIYLASSGAVKGAYHYDKPKPNIFRNNNEIDVVVKVESDGITATCGAYSASVSGTFTPANNPQKSIEAVNTAFAKTGDTSFNLHSLTIENPQNLFTPTSMLNELRRDLYGKIKISEFKGKLPPLPTVDKPVAQPKFIIKVDNLNYLNLLNLNNFAEIIYLLNPQSDIGELNKLPKNKIRIALPAVCRHPETYKDIIQRLLDGGYHKWEVANYWALEILPLKQLDISFDSSLYMLNTQAIAMAAECGALQIALSLEDIKANICNIIEKSNLRTALIIYQDIPLFTGVGCIRDNDCRSCDRKPLWFDLERQGRKFKALSQDCQMMVFDNKPYCIAADAQDLRPDFFRMDFAYREYSPEKVRQIADDLLQGKDVTDCIKGNFLNKNI